MYYKILRDGYIIAIGKSNECKNNITETEYNKLKELFLTRPKAEGKEYRLKEDLTWEEFEAVKVDVEEQATDVEYTEAGKILLGVYNDDN